MSDTIRIVPPPSEQHRETYLKMLSGFIPRVKLDALIEVFGDDIFFLFNELQGEQIRFPRLKTLNDMSNQAAVFDLVEAKMAHGLDDEEALEETARDTGKKVATVKRLHGVAGKQIEKAVI